LEESEQKVLFLIATIYEINNTKIRNRVKLATVNARGAALALFAGESPVHHSFGDIFLARPRAGFFFDKNQLGVEIRRNCKSY
jgi:hypothetical protein